MLSALFLTAREGFEGALIAGLIFAYLKRTGNSKHFKYVWYAIASAALISVGAAAILFATATEFEGRGEEIFEGSIMIVAALVVTHVWRRFHNMRGETERKTDRALLHAKVGRAIFFAAFVAVLIEGLEIVLFLLASWETGTANIIVGGIVGLAVAIFAGWIFYQSKRISDAILFFYILGAVLIVIAAGLLAHGVHELQEASIFPVLKENIWNFNSVPVIGEGAGFGKFMKTTIGYNGNPELLEFLIWFSYIVIAAWYFNAPRFAGMLFRKTSKLILR